MAVPLVDFSPLDLSTKGHLGPAVTCDLNLTEGQCVAFVLRTPPSITTNSRGPDAVLGQHTGAEIVPNQVEATTLGIKTRSVEDPLLTSVSVYCYFYFYKAIADPTSRILCAIS